MLDKLKLQLRQWNDRRLGKKYQKRFNKAQKTKPSHVSYFMSDGTPMYRTKKAIYEIGYPDPSRYIWGQTADINHPDICFDPRGEVTSEFTRGYNSFSGVDIKVCFNEKPVGTVQGFDFERFIDGDGKVRIHGDVMFIMFDQHQDLIGKTLTMTAVASNEYGTLSCLFSEKIRFIKQKYGISVDDIVSQEHYVFEGVTDETIEEHQERISKTTGIVKPKELQNETD